MKVRYRLFFSVLLALGIMHASADSLWQSEHSNCSLFADVRARSVGDIVTVEFKSNTIIAAEHDTGVAPNTKFPFVKKMMDRLFHRTSATMPPLYNSTEAIYENTTLSMQIMDVLPNGNLVLEGVRKYKFWDAYKFEVIRGIARQQDIAYNNTLDSCVISNLTIDYATGNSFEDAKRNGLITHLNNLLDPY